MNKKRIERIAVFALAASLVGMFFYQVAHAISFSNYLNGTMTETFDNGTTKVYQKGSPEYNKHVIPGDWFDPGNGTWTMYNSTSGSVSEITFSSEMVGGFMHNQTFIRILNGHIHKGTYIGPFLKPGQDLKTLKPWETLNLCERIHYKGLFPSVCAVLHPMVLNSDHMEFKDDHGGIIHLIR